MRPIYSLKRTGIVILLAISAVLLWNHHNRRAQARDTSDVNIGLSYGRATLGVASKIYVISLPARVQRREQMEKLRERLGLRWQYVDAVDSHSALANSLLNWVKAVRAGPPLLCNEVESLNGRNTSSLRFQWPPEIDALSSSGALLDLWSSGIWPTPSGLAENSTHEPIACATRDFHVLNYTVDLPQHMILTTSRIAVWHSHLSVIQAVSNNNKYDDDGVAIILEDDIDVERDIHQQLKYLWTLLPADWDMVFLGHCWSNEEYHPSIMRDSAHVTEVSPVVSASHLHPSRSPKCTHAYALSRTGARRLLLHLRYPPFAYSRAIDQAFAWLVESGRLKSYSIVPSLVVQRKVEDSDVMPGKGSMWKDHLVDGVLDNATAEQAVL